MPLVPIPASARLVLVLLFIGMGATVVRGQDRLDTAPVAVPDTVVQRVATAFRDGDAQALLAPATDRVEVSLFGTQTFYSSAQAFYVLRDFFDSHPPAAFATGDATTAGRSAFVQGRYGHRRDERTLQVYVRLVHRDQQWRLQEVRIDADTE
jgi:hypothetical protein